jgi:hypothetical protein
MSNGKEMKIDFPAQLKGGVYANNLVIAHTKEEFILDFIVLAPPAGTVTSRIITSPGHMKRIIKALQENVAKYEARFGDLPEAEVPQGNMGFQ